MLKLVGLPLAGTCFSKLKVDHEMPLYRLNFVSESFLESLYFNPQNMHECLKFFCINNQQKEKSFSIYERDFVYIFKYEPPL